MKPLPIHYDSLRPHTWTAQAPDPIAYRNGPLLEAAGALVEAFKQACDEHQRHPGKEVKVNGHLAETPVQGINVSLKLSGELSSNPCALNDAMLLANLALNPGYCGVDQCSADAFRESNGRFEGAHHHPLAWSEPPEYLDHGVEIRKVPGGGYSAFFFSKNLDALLGTEDAPDETYPLLKQLNAMLQQWQHALEKELMLPKRWEGEFDSKFQIRKKEAPTSAGRAFALLNTASAAEVADEMAARCDQHNMSLADRAVLLNSGYSPLMVSVAEGHEANMIALLTDAANKANPNAWNKLNRDGLEVSAYSVAIWEKNVRMIKLLAHYGAKPESPRLMKDAILSGEIALVHTLQEMGVSLDRGSVTAAFEQPNDDIFQSILNQLSRTTDIAMLKSAISPGGLDRMLFTPDISATRWRELSKAVPPKKLKELLQPDDKNNLLDSAARCNNSIAAHWFLEAGADPNGCYFSNGRQQQINPLFYAAKDGNIKLATALVEKGAKIRRRVNDNDLDTPLSIALKLENKPLIELFTNSLSRPVSRGGGGPGVDGRS